MVQPTKTINHRVALAVAAHPDDIEFMMTGTLLLLGQAGYSLHMWNLSNGHCGSTTLPPETIAETRYKEASDSAALAGATLHPPLTGDIEILYTSDLIRQAAARIRIIKPSIILLPSPRDYMEDHQTTSRLIITAAFVRAMKNFHTLPPSEPWNGAVVLYHALPHGLRDQLRKRIIPGQYVDIAAVIGKKRDMLACHTSQKEWLDQTQGIGAYIQMMDEMAAEVGSMSGAFAYAEGWRRHSHWGFAGSDDDPLAEALGARCLINYDYEKKLDAGC